MHPMLEKEPLPPDDYMPNYWKLLDEEDLNEYIRLKRQFSSNSRVGKKEKQDDIFRQKLDRIKGFINNGRDGSWKRSVVCGIVFLADSIAINIQQLTVLLGKCKSSINGSLQNLKYVSLGPGNKHEGELAAKIPFKYLDRRESKKWTIRESRRENTVRGQFPSIMTFLSPEDGRALLASGGGGLLHLPGGVIELGSLGAQIKPRFRNRWDYRGADRIRA